MEVDFRHRREIARDRSLLFCLLMAGAYVDAVAAPASGQTTTPVSGGFLVTLLIAYLARRRAIGGWLLYYYMQLYGSFLVALIFLGGTFANLNPSGWDSSLRYVLFFLSTIPVLIAQTLEVGAGTLLLFRRNIGNIQLLRGTLLGLTVASAAALAIDATYFSESVAALLDALTLGFACIWLVYFWRSKRVRAVFIERAWDYALFSPPRVLTPPERKYLAKRAGIASLATFVILLLSMGSALGDKKPDTAIFVVPTFYALIAAAVAWCAPIRKKKREALAQRSASADPAAVE